MIDIERRLQHAARELREVEIEPPPLHALSSPVAAGRRPSGVLGRVPALVMPVLFVLGGLAVVAGGAGRQANDAADATAVTVADVPDDTTNDATDDMPDDAGPDSVAASPDGPSLTAREEIALISALAPSGSAGGAVPSPPPTSPPTSLRHYR